MARKRCCCCSCWWWLVVVVVVVMMVGNGSPEEAAQFDRRRPGPSCRRAICRRMSGKSGNTRVVVADKGWVVVGVCGCSTTPSRQTAAGRSIGRGLFGHLRPSSTIVHPAPFSPDSTVQPPHTPSFLPSMVAVRKRVKDDQFLLNFREERQLSVPGVDVRTTGTDRPSPP